MVFKIHTSEPEVQATATLIDTLFNYSNKAYRGDPNFTLLLLCLQCWHIAASLHTVHPFSKWLSSAHQQQEVYNWDTACAKYLGTIIVQLTSLTWLYSWFKMQLAVVTQEIVCVPLVYCAPIILPGNSFLFHLLCSKLLLLCSKLCPKICQICILVGFLK